MATDKTHPTRDEAREQNLKISHMTIFIDQTKGLWLRTVEAESDDTGNTELWYDGIFQCSWGPKLQGVNLALEVGREAVNIGERKRAKAIKELLNA